jgi:hypothetical protein
MSEEEKYTRYLHEFSQALLVVLGVVFTLLVVVVSGDTMWYGHGAPFGWFALWFITTTGSIPLGVAMLIGGGWKKLPISRRRATAMGYLLVGFVNFFSLAVHMSTTAPGIPIYILPVGYGLVLMVVYARVYNAEDKAKEEMFP